MKKISISVLSIIFLLSFFLSTNKALAAPLELFGFAWSGNVGWISFNSGNDGVGTGAAYSVKIATTTGSNIATFSGHAWSSNIGWISFQNGDASHPNATVNMTTGAVNGWARATAAIGRTDGWDGWIELSGAYHVTNGTEGEEGITYDPTSGDFYGFAWGSDVIGWLGFAVGSEPVCIEGIDNTNCGDNPPSEPDLTFGVRSGGITGNYVGNATIVVPNELTDFDAQVDIKWKSTSGIINCVSDYSNSDWNDAGLTQEEVDSMLNDDCGDNSEHANVLTFGNISSTTPKKYLRIKYQDETKDLGFWFPAVVSVSFTGTNIVITPPADEGVDCPVPVNSRSCENYTSTTTLDGTFILRRKIEECESTIGNPIACEYYCPNGLVRNSTGRKCVLPADIQEF